MAAGLSAIYDQGVVKYSLGWTVTNLPATPTNIGVSLHSGAIGTNKVSVTEWTSGANANTNYLVRLSMGVGSANWSVAAFVAGTGVVAGNAVQQAFFSPGGLTGTGSNILAVALQDALAVGAGNLLWFADISSQAVATGIIVQFNTGSPSDITVTLL